jgi:riboflavin biosynthesis pyrimidine reductase
VGLPPGLRRRYGGDLRLGSPILYANFVSSIDGVVAVEDTPGSGSLLSGGNTGDRFVMGLLRAVAEAVLMGAGTLRATPGHRWTAQHIFPALAADFAGLRRQLGLTPDPLLVVLTASGDLDPSHPALQAGALVLTTADGARRARRVLPSTCEVRSISRGKSVGVRRVVEVIRADGHDVILSEAGPVVTGQLVRQRLVDDLFLTVSPVVAGRVRGDGNKGLVEGVHLLPDQPAWMRLAEARRQASHLFLRYQKD